jgi:hypothetical protein
MSYLASFVTVGAAPGLQNCVTLRTPVKQNSSHYGPDLAETLVGSEIFCDPVAVGPGQERSRMRKLQNFVGGAYRDAEDGPSAPLIDPSTGQPFAEAPVSGAADIDAALRVAAEAFSSWKRTTPSERSLALFRIADALEARGEDLVRAESENTGKPFQLTMDEEIPPMVDQIRFFAGAARNLEGLAAAEYMAGHTSFVRREPVGVCGAGCSACGSRGSCRSWRSPTRCSSDSPARP